MNGTGLILDDDGLPCFVAGSRLKTERGDIPVEQLREGDRVLTLANGQMIPLAITWIGQRRIDLIRHPQPDLARPIRIHRHAFAPNIPGRDLLVSPDHAILVDGGLIPAKHLLNDGSIIEDRTL
ncbi:MAG TPA: Hint domain-containing protein, partial [Acetobacteraceae bacterium]|nr:Hint domain-containing protein [Acetobacteraceae bacterium]